MPKISPCVPSLSHVYLTLGMPQMGANRVIRGGGWNNNARNVRAASRNANEPSNRNDNVGFRVSRAQRWSGLFAIDPGHIQPFWF